MHEDGSPFVCTNCEAGKYNDLTAQTACQPCTAGYYCPAVPPLGAIKPVPCPGGTYSAATNLVDASGCTTVEAGFYAPLGCAARIPCPTGDQWSCPGNTALPIDLGGGLAAGLEASCPAGTVQYGTPANPNCIDCPKGFFCRGGVANPCAEGQWLNHTGAQNSTSCRACPSGTLCPPGTIIPNVREGYFLADPLSGRPAHQCPSQQACLGGVDYGELSCEVGHMGLLCGTCTAGYYRGRFECLSCLDVGSTAESSQQTVLLMVGLSVLLILVITLYFGAPDGETARRGSTKTITTTGQKQEVQTLVKGQRVVVNIEDVTEGDKSGTVVLVIGDDIIVRFDDGMLASRKVTREQIVSIVEDEDEAAGEELVGRISPSKRLGSSTFDINAPSQLTWTEEVTVCCVKFGVIYRKLLASHIFSLCTSLTKVLISFSQCLGTIKRLNRVKWPHLFIAFMERLDLLNLELFSVVPAECVTGDRLGFMFELLATVLVPIIMFATAILVLLAIRCVRRRRSTSPLPSLYSDIIQPRMFTLMSWVLLLMYPPLARKSLAFFHCVEAGVDSKGAPIFLMRDDPAIQCYGGDWWAWSPVAFLSVAVYCVGLPLLSFVLTRRWRNTYSRSRVAVLINTYKDEYWQMESLSLLHKLFFTGVILHVATDERMQLWVGATASVAVFILYLLSRPMRHAIADHCAVAALFQLILVYMSAFVFFDDGGTSVVSQESAGLGVVLVLINSTCFLVVIVFLVRKSTADRIKRRRDAARQRFPSCDWTLAKGQSYVCFISHVKATTGAEARYLKDTLEEILGCPCFLDTSNLADLRYLFSAGVHISQALVVLLSDDLLTRPWCLLEIYEAVRMDKPIIFVQMPHKPFSFDDALTLIRDLEGKMPVRNPWCLEELRAHLGAEPLSTLQRVLDDVIGGAVQGGANKQVARINLSSGTFNQLEAQMTNLVEMMHVALEQKGGGEQTGGGASERPRGLAWKGIKRGTHTAGRMSAAAGHSSVAGDSRFHRGFAALTRQRSRKDQHARFMMVYHAGTADAHAKALSAIIENEKAHVSVSIDARMSSEAMEDGLGDVQNAKCLILLQTRLVLSQPWPLLAAYWASLHDVPIVCVLVEGSGYDFGTAKRSLASLQTAMSSRLLTQLDQILERSRPAKGGHPKLSVASLQAHLASLLPSVISVSYNPKGTQGELAATVHDIEDKLNAAKVIKAFRYGNGKAPAAAKKGGSNPETAPSLSLASATVPASSLATETAPAPTSTLAPNSVDARSITTEELERACLVLIRESPEEFRATVLRYLKMGILTSTFQDSLAKEIGVDDTSLRTRKPEIMAIVTRLLGQQLETPAAAVAGGIVAAGTRVMVTRSTGEETVGFVIEYDSELNAYSVALNAIDSDQYKMVPAQLLVVSPDADSSASLIA